MVFIGSGESSRASLFSWLRLEGLAVMLLSVLLYGRSGESWWLFGGFFFVPDVSMLLYLLSKEAGSVGYNLVHTYALPLILLGLAVWRHRLAWAAMPLIWTAHIGFDRALGYGLKYPGSFEETHLGRIGEKG